MANDQQNPNQNASQKADAENQADQMSTAGRIPGQDDPDPKASGNPEATSTQENMGDGSGIRGNYGDAGQTNGLEGGPDSAPDGSPDDQGAE
jgi:hypothetical protein